MMLENDVDAFAVCETWLVHSVGDSIVALPGYSLFRKDVVGSARKHEVCRYICSASQLIYGLTMF